MDAVWDGRSGGSGDEESGFGIGPRKGVILGASLERAIVTNGDFAERLGPVPKLLSADLFK